jgi:hypothetical protein
MIGHKGRSRSLSTATGKKIVERGKEKRAKSAAEKLIKGLMFSYGR